MTVPQPDPLAKSAGLTEYAAVIALLATCSLVISDGSRTAGRRTPGSSPPTRAGHWGG